MHAKSLFTIGYQGAESADFVATLVASGVAKVIDVRDVPLSRKRGFSKRALAEALDGNGIAYIHLKELGDPKPGREAAQRGEFATFRKIFYQHLEGSDAQAALETASRIARQTASCLLCFEREHEHCHRTIVAEALSKKAGFTIRHLRVSRDTIMQKKGHDQRKNDRQLALR